MLSYERNLPLHLYIQASSKCHIIVAGPDDFLPLEVPKHNVFF